MEEQLRNDLEFNLTCGARYINKIAESLKGKLPEVITKEELMNFYLHNMCVKGGIDTNVTVVNLVQAANIAGIKVKGQSLLEVNVSFREQLRYLNLNEASRTGRRRHRRIKDELEDKETLIKNSLMQGASISEIAERFNCCRKTVVKFLDNKGIRKQRAKRMKEVTN